MSKIAIIGDKETIFPFNFFGFITKYVNEGNARAEFRSLIKQEEIKIIFVTENITPFIEKDFKESLNRAFPIITVIPTVSEKTGEKREDVVKLIERIIGPNLLKEE
ncbi:V-type ATP synthase subunit F [bacterium]|nr:V-type ATP synthase subunit F [bacterium]